VGTASQLVLSGCASPITSGGATCVATATLEDASGNTVNDSSTVTFAEGGSDVGSITFGSVTDTAGVYTVTVTGVRAGAVSITADDTTDSITSNTVDTSVVVSSSGTGPVSVAKGSQIITFTSSNPSLVTVGGASYTPTATATSGLAVAFTIDASSTSGACSISGGVVSFTGVGTCIVDANQAGNANYFAAPEKQQTITVTSPGVGGPPISGKVQPKIHVAAVRPWTLVSDKTVHLNIHLWGRRGTVTGTAKLLLGKKLLCALKLVKGRGHCTVSSSKVGRGQHLLTVKYLGSSKYLAAIYHVNVYVHH
jgi:hypothetical protein